MNATSVRPTRRSVSPLAVVLLTIMWVLLWGDLSWGNLVAGIVLALLITWLVPMPRGPRRRLTVRPVATARLMARFAWDVVEASAHIVAVIFSGRTPREAIIRVQTRAHSDAFLAATAGFTALVPGSIVIDAHRLTGILYIHVFDVAEGDEALEEAHQRVLDQEERLLRAFATRSELVDAGLLGGEDGS
ncbi:Na+/H+ antiporter subunit E [Brooklawnia cerclae]|uniref:Multicomponent Na+:H+ antiporter subunit E n=1 Tax=Brooklawnia cerclae TaxID=349934 RepID=A0ABX0SP05_9ACTN|nr:Na+/H+ antiporter subunit E [Brooklawnia cerclae]NIH58770.1 multicomponent Na+:H+ antiporter subunit E [Brooklawnia cerclae]